jgi:cysteinyl-tRNA synthetase
VPFWLHNEFINLREAKMAKSRGGTLLLSDLEQQGFDPLSYRFFLLGSHYRNQTEFTWRGLEGARVAQRRLLERLGERGPRETDPLTYEEAAARLEGPERVYLERLDEAISNDLNTAQALAVLTEVSRAPLVGPDDLMTLAGAFEAVLAVGLLDLVPEDVEPPPRELLIAPGEVDRLLDEREEARRRGDFGVADEIREMLERLGIEVRDTSDGTVWKIRAAVTARDSDDDRA